MPTWVIYLRPKSSVGTWLSSETIFGAICWAMRMVEGEKALSDWLGYCQSDQPEWFVSSAFPFVDANTVLRFLPKPLTLNPDAEIVAEFAGNNRKQLVEAMRKAKTIAKAAFISERLFESAIKGDLTARDLLEKALNGEVEIRSGCLLSSHETDGLPKRLWTTTDTQHTAVDRVLTSAAEGLLYFDTEHFFGSRVGLFFLLRCPESFPVDTVVRFWKHDGLGGNRSVGKGHFEPEAKLADDWLANLQPTDGNAVVLLSRCIPKDGEFDLDKSAYRLVGRRPKFESAFGQPYRVYKGIIRSIAEGSVLVPKQKKDAFGQLLKVGEQTDFDGVAHPVYHNGIGFPVRMVMR